MALLALAAGLALLAIGVLLVAASVCALGGE
jgi:hypothetical protein